MAVGCGGDDAGDGVAAGSAQESDGGSSSVQVTCCGWGSE